MAMQQTEALPSIQGEACRVAPLKISGARRRAPASWGQIVKFPLKVAALAAACIRGPATSKSHHGARDANPSKRDSRVPPARKKIEKTAGIKEPSTNSRTTRAGTNKFLARNFPDAD